MKCQPFSSVARKMEEQSLKQKATHGVLWSFVDQIATQGISFLIGIILARILSPSDYGLIGMLSIFMAIAQSFIDSGFSSALVQKTDRTETDFSTVFYFNLGIGFLFYLLLFITSPWIANFYGIPLLEPITKVFALNFVISALSIVHRTKLLIKVDFKTQMKISIISVVISGSIGITLAYKGFGVWALVSQSLVAAVCQTILFWFFTKWKPLFVFSKESFDRLFRYGSKLLASGLLYTIYLNIYTIVIGKLFSASDLGYYSRAKQLESLPAENLTTVLMRVSFPILCSIQDDNARFIGACRKLIRNTSFITFPSMFLLISIAKPLVILLLTKKWLPAVDLFQILCFAGMWYPINAINNTILRAKGRSDLFLRLEVWKTIVGTVILIISIPFGLKSLVVGQAFTSFICLFINAYYTGRYINYGIARQLMDISIFVFSSIFLCGITVASIQLFDSNWIQLIAGSLIYTGSYFIVSKLFRFDELKEVMSILLKPFSRLSEKAIL
jgi:O-antigen/teichoic acid export membrane protein